jgi:hypothetical protein
MQRNMARITYVGFRRDAYGFKLHVRFRFGVVQIGNRSRCPNPWPNFQNAGDAVPLNENASVLWKVLVREYQAHNLLACF